MSKKRKTVAEKREYQVLNVKQAKSIANNWLKEIDLLNEITFGLPEINDRYHNWRVPLLHKKTEKFVGEFVIDAYTSNIDTEKSSNYSIINQRIEKFEKSNTKADQQSKKKKKKKITISPLNNTIAQGKSEQVLQEFPNESINLVFTSPPYFNAKPEYNDYVDYDEYLENIRKVIKSTHRVLSEGRFFIINVSPVLLPRKSRNDSSTRVAVPFDIHQLFVEEGFEFMDDIIWKKPEGAGWATGRGRRFAADRNPLQYKPVPVTEYVLVYRKKTDRLIDWNIKKHPDQEVVKESKIKDGYETTNVWEIKPSHDSRHPAIFPLELASKVIEYYSFVNDVVLDPFAGIGTLGEAAYKLDRRFVLIEKNSEYVSEIKKEAKGYMGKKAKSIRVLNTESINTDDMLL